MPNMFTFKANRYTEAFAEHGYVHIPGGLSEEFHVQLVNMFRIRSNKSI